VNYVTNWKIVDILMVCRFIMEMAKGNFFYKKQLEVKIFAWMPMWKVRGLY